METWKWKRKEPNQNNHIFAISRLILSLCIFICCLSSKVASQLVINVKNDGGDLIQESIQADVRQDVIHLQFQKLDGTLLKLLIDFKSEVQIFKIIVLGEEERAESQYRIMCYVTKFSKSEFISSDAMSKLRQKNPGTIRNPEEDRGSEQLFMDLGIHLEHASRISPHIYNACMEAKDSIYTREMDIKAWSKGSNLTYTALMNTVHVLPSTKTKQRCSAIQDVLLPCSCRLEICIGWYPCGLKYCRGRDSAGNVVSYRCGIKTCKKCRAFDYYVEQKQHCLWDEP